MNLTKDVVQVLEALRRADELTADDVAAAARMPMASVRVTLEQFENTGWVTSRYVWTAGVQGKVFRLVDELRTGPREERTVSFLPAWHRCHPEPRKNYGIGAVRMTWVLRLGDDAVTWELTTNWHLPKDQFRAACPDCEHPRHQDGAPRVDLDDEGLGRVTMHHADPDGEPCTVLGTRCSTGAGSYLMSSALFDTLRCEGDEAVWQAMRRFLESH